VESRRWHLLWLVSLDWTIRQASQDKGLWTGPKVADWIAKKTGREKVWSQRGWDYLKKCRYSSQRPRPRHVKADPEAQEEFKKNGTKQLENCNKNFLMQR
jgi:transposase